MDNEKFKKVAEELKAKKQKERKAQLQEYQKREKEKYYAFYSDVKTSARDNGEW